MQNRQKHQQQAQAFLQKQYPNRHWEFSLPKGTGNETYFVRSGEQIFFVKLGVHVEKYQVVASIGLTPQVLAVGTLDDGTSIIVQAYIAGRNPLRKDYRNYLEQFATAINMVHHHPGLKQILPQASSDFFSVVGLKTLIEIQQRWKRFETQVPDVADFVNQSIDYLEYQVRGFQGTGLVASHNDICNANWLISNDEKLYLIDLESMSLDDPAFDIGATLWWYYPPELRQKFLTIVNHANDKAFEHRMQVRMAMHCLNISLPRDQSFDEFDPGSFSEWLTDFKAILAGEENPQGYDD
jgi:aminoglycoside phosphotransferase (APT) family kinase protein